MQAGTKAGREGGGKGAGPEGAWKVLVVLDWLKLQSVTILS